MGLGGFSGVLGGFKGVLEVLGFRGFRGGFRRWV